MKSRIRRDLLGGIVALTPILVTLYVGLWIYNKIVGLPGSRYLELTNIPVLNRLIQFLLALFIILFVLVFVGELVRTAMGIYLHTWVDRVARRIPVLRLIYNAAKMAIEAMLGDTSKLQKPVKLEIGEFRLTGFKTGGKTKDGRHLVFVPTSPNITSGVVVEVREEDMEEADERIEDALTRVLSAGFGESNEDKTDIVSSYFPSDVDEDDSEK